MKHPPRISDYGGNKPYRTSFRKNHGDKSGLMSMRCCSCDTLRYVHPREMDRAAMPRCLLCGGPLEEIDKSRKRRGLPKKAKAMLSSLSDAKPRCKGCGKLLASALFPVEQALVLHFQSGDECRRYYVDERYVFRVLRSNYILGTQHVEPRRSNGFVAKAMNESGDVVELPIRGTKKHCIEELNSLINGGESQ